MAAPEPGVFDKFTGAVSGIVQKAKEAVSGTAETVTAPAKTALPEVATDRGAARMLGTASERKGFTSTGGRRYRKKTAKRHSKKHKTMRRRH